MSSCSANRQCFSSGQHLSFIYKRYLGADALQGAWRGQTASCAVTISCGAGKDSRRLARGKYGLYLARCFMHVFNRIFVERKSIYPTISKNL